MPEALETLRKVALDNLVLEAFHPSYGFLNSCGPVYLTTDKPKEDKGPRVSPPQDTVHSLVLILAMQVKSQGSKADMEKSPIEDDSTEKGANTTSEGYKGLLTSIARNLSINSEKISVINSESSNL